MKKFKFYALAFAAIAFAGCSDDVIDGKGGNNGMQGDGTPAYLTISFTANGGNSSRSTADDANNNGDEHNGAEDSGHHSSGISGESDINQILVVVAPESEGSSATGFANIYTIADEETAGEDNFVEVNSATKTYKNAEPITVTTGDYNVLVVVNPTSEISSPTVLSNPVELYQTILDGEYDYETVHATDLSAYPANYTNAANSIGMGLGYDGTSTDDAGFMMANKAEASVTLNKTNTPNNPAKVNIDVERVLSKITFRSTTPQETNKENVYAVKVNVGSTPAITIEGAIQDEGSDPATYTVYTLNEAKDAVGNTIYALYNEASLFQGAYTKDTDAPQQSGKDVYVKLTAKTVAEYNAETNEENKVLWYAVEDADGNGSVNGNEASMIELQFDTDAEIEQKNWYVKLEGYALVNLSKTVNYVRHTIASAGTAMTPFGTLDGSNFLWTPNWDNNNNIVFVADENGEMQFPAGTTTDGWFYNTLAQVSEESANLTIESEQFKNNGAAASYYKTFASMLDDDSNVGLEGDDSHYPDDPQLPSVGKLMSYCFENSTDIEHQTHGLSTGISFVATIWNNAECTQPIEKLYLYQGHNYTSIQQIKDAYGAATPDAIKELTETSTKEELEAADVKLYNSNICYYYTTEIKHFDNGKPNELGNMEFAIMRNNIYSLSVTKIEQIGDPIVDPTPGIVNESEEAALEVQAKILPWIVRYNDIEF